MKLVIANVVKQHSYQTALAAYEAGFLQRLITGIYYKPNQLSSKLSERLLSGMRLEKNLRRMRLRRQSEIPDSLVTSIAWPEIIEQLWKQNQILGKSIHPDTVDTVTYLKNEIFDLLVSRLYLSRPQCDLFHGFEQCALFSLRKAKAIGAITLLDEPVIHRALWDRLESAERRKLKLPPPKRPFWYGQHIERKYKELELADYIFVGLDFVRSSFIESGFPEDRIFLIPYGVEVSELYRPIERPHKRTFNILFVGQISWYKGLHYFLEAYDRLKIQDVKLTVIGMLHNEWSDYFKRRFSQVKKPFEYLGTVPRAEMPKYYAEADVFVFPSLGGGIGLATYEAMAAGLPVITADGDVVIRDGIDGLVIKAEDIEGWNEALSRLYEDYEKRIQLGFNAAKRVQLFTWEAYRAGVVQAYSEIAKRG